ncbi:MAG: hypothetical protein BAJALOKI2v1_690007 [Promethearchaeota archaeon]|nr:MAG: hypothetical protein BAJALOKI2v1_690007 [Candidatus Lokiarchaeota archaeon]
MSEIKKLLLIKNLKSVDKTLGNELILIPKPHHLSYISKNGAFAFTSESQLLFYGVDSKEIFQEIINDFLEKFTRSRIIDGGNIENISKIQEDIHSSELKGNEDYILKIEKTRISICALEEQGLFYGVQTLLQIFKNSFLEHMSLKNRRERKLQEIFLPNIEIIDSPDIKMRGVAYDCSRGQIFTVESAKRFIKILSHYKLNTMCFYMEDTFAHPKHPLIGKKRGAFTPEEIREIDKYAKDHFMELIPIFECLGHADNILQHEDYYELGEFPGAHSFDISNPDVLEFVEDYISLISETFSTGFFHVGCDETFDIGQHRSKEYIEKVGKEEALTEFYERLLALVKTHKNDHMIMYDDFVRKNKKIRKNLSKEIIQMFWDYDPKEKYPPVEDLIEDGFKVIVSPSMLNWNRNFPDYENASKNIMALTEEAFNFKDEGCLGVLTSTWGDQRYFSLKENEIFGAVLTAGKTWNVKEFNYEEFKKKYAHLFYGIRKELLLQFSHLFTKISSSPSLFYRFMVILPPLFYTDLFKHPFPEKEFKPALKNYIQLKDRGTEVLGLYSQLESEVLFEKENFEFIQYGAELARYAGEKIELSVEISEMIANSKLTHNEKAEIIEKLRYIQHQIKGLKDQYEVLWLRASKRPCLNENLQLFDFLINCYEEKISQIKEGITFKNPYLESEWIWANETLCPQKPRYFRKKYTVKEDIEKAVIQGLVCNQMKVFVNENEVGQVLGRFSLSRLPILLRVKTFDITEYLKKGENIIAVEAYNYDGYKGAFNLYSQILLKNGEIQELKTDQSWVSQKEKTFQSEGWQSLDFEDMNWQKVKSYGTPPNLNGDIIKPNLLNGEKSHTQDYYGGYGYLFNGLLCLKNDFYVKYILRPIIFPILKRIVEPYG